jgi:hypothetical protein
MCDIKFLSQIFLKLRQTDSYVGSLVINGIFNPLLCSTIHNSGRKDTSRHSQKDGYNDNHAAEFVPPYVFPCNGPDHNFYFLMALITVNLKIEKAGINVAIMTIEKMTRAWLR